jgi:type II secretory pathway pseudopilin PulG
MGLAGQGRSADQAGYAMAALLVGMSVMAVMMAAALPVWNHAARREKEAELVWRGEQYRRAIMLFQRKYANSFPPSVDLLVEQKFLRKKYKDPITNEDFLLIPVGGGMPGQVSPNTPGAPGQAGGGFGSGGSFGSGGGLGSGAGGMGGGGLGSGGFGQQAGGLGQGTPGATGGLGTSKPGGTGQSTAGGAKPGSVGPGGVVAGGGLVTGATNQAGLAGRSIQGVTSKSSETSIRIYNGMDKYNQWAFVALASANQAGQGGAAFGTPGQTGQPGAFGQPVPPGGNPFGQPGSFGQPGRFGQPMQPGGQSPFGQPQPSPFSPPGGGGFGQPGGAQPNPFGQPGKPTMPAVPAPPGGSIFKPVPPPPPQF